MYGEYNGRGPFPVMFAKPEATAFVHAILATATNCAPSCDVFQHLLIATPLLQVTPGWWAAPQTPGGRCCGGEAPEITSPRLEAGSAGGSGRMLRLHAPALCIL